MGRVYAFIRKYGVRAHDFKKYLRKNWHFIIVLYLAPMLAYFSITTPSAIFKMASQMIGITSENVGSTEAYMVLSVVKNIDAGRTGSKSYDVSQGFIPTIYTPFTIVLSSIDPNEGYNTGVVEATLMGADFAAGATVKLTKNGEEILGVVSSIDANSKITCKLDLTGKGTGAWNVVVTNMDKTAATILNGFTINTLAQLGSLINYPNPFNPAKEKTVLVYALEKDEDVSIFLFNISTELVWRREFMAGANGGKEGDNSVEWDGTNGFGEMSANGIYFCRVIERSTGKVLAKGRIGVSR